MRTRNSAVKRILQILFPLVVLAGIVAAISWRTHGFAAFTTYSYALEQADPIGKPFAEDFYVLAEDSSRSKLFQESDHYTLMGIVFLKCEMICPLINQRLYQVYLELVSDPLKDVAAKAVDASVQRVNSIQTASPSGLSGKLQVMTLSFDSERDNVNDLIEYKSRFLGDELMRDTTDGPVVDQTEMKNPRSEDHQSRWQFTVANGENILEIRQKLLAAGFWYYEVMPGMYNHSPYFFLIGPDGTVQNVYDPGKLSHRELMTQLMRDVR